MQMRLLEENYEGDTNFVRFHHFDHRQSKSSQTVAYIDARVCSDTLSRCIRIELNV